MEDNLIFRLELYNNDPYVQPYEKNAKWAADCNGLPVEKINSVLYCCTYVIDSRWCEYLGGNKNET